MASANSLASPEDGLGVNLFLMLVGGNDVLTDVIIEDPLLDSRL